MSDEILKKSRILINQLISLALKRLPGSAFLMCKPPSIEYEKMVIPTLKGKVDEDGSYEFWEELE